MPISYVVSVATTKSTMIVIPVRIPPFIWLHVLSLAACCGAFALFLYGPKLRGLNSVAGLSSVGGWMRAAALTILATLCVFEVGGCGGGVAGGVSPQSVPTPHVIGTPQGTSIITLTPAVTTSTGASLQGVAPIQLTLTVQ
jgi:hypothetical protein